LRQTFLFVLFAGRQVVKLRTAHLATIFHSSFLNFLPARFFCPIFARV
jgi:hypothetical protein